MSVSIVKRMSPNFQAANARKVGFILHWMAGYLPGTDATFARANGIATHYGIGSADGRGNRLEVHQYVADKDRSFGSFNKDADTRGLSIEIENDIRLPYPGKPTTAVHELVAQFMASKAIEHDMRLPGHDRVRLVLGDFPDHRNYQKAIPAFGRDYNVTTHRSMALKDCPGTTDVAWIVQRANEIINGVAVEVAPIIERSRIVAGTIIIKHVLVDGKTRNERMYQYDGREGVCEIGDGVETGFALAVRDQDGIKEVHGWEQFNMLNNAARAVRDKARQNEFEDAKRLSRSGE